MKKRILTSLVLLSAVFVMNAQTDNSDYARWSLQLKGFLDYVNITPTGASAYDNASWVVGAALEREVNPVLGFGFGLDYLRYNRNTVSGTLYDPNVFTSINLSNLLKPERKSDIINVHAKFGAGTSINVYKNALLTPGAARVDGKDWDNFALLLTALDHEFNVSKSLAFGGEAGYRSAYGTTCGFGYRSAYTAMVTARYKFGATSKQHLRNMTAGNFTKAAGPQPYDDSALRGLLDNAQKQNKDLQNQVGKLGDDLDKLKNDDTLDKKVKELEDECAKLKAQGPVEKVIERIIEKPVEKLELSSDYSLSEIQFKVNSAELTSEALPVLNEIAKILKDKNDWETLIINGHTDSSGAAAYNQTMSERRAEAVKTFLVSKGLNAASIKAVGHGSSQPAYSNATAEGRNANRRIEFDVVKK